MVTGLMLGLDSENQFSDHFASISHNRNVRMTQLTDFGRVNVGVNDLCIRSETVDLTSDSVIKTRSERNEQV
ncbi:unannotated protein [freshwater metagenome]|uniref:Unannotated protein n=1 Tax=freshwater metagenome TaxID=449393 RepID=A0A6J6WB48_9ZZZZ